MKVSVEPLNKDGTGPVAITMTSGDRRLRLVVLEVQNFMFTAPSGSSTWVGVVSPSLRAMQDAIARFNDPVAPPSASEAIGNSKLDMIQGLWIGARKPASEAPAEELPMVQGRRPKVVEQCQDYFVIKNSHEVLTKAGEWVHWSQSAGDFWFDAESALA